MIITNLQGLKKAGLAIRYDTIVFSLKDTTIRYIVEEDFLSIQDYQSNSSNSFMKSVTTNGEDRLVKNNRLIFDILKIDINNTQKLAQEAYGYLTMENDQLDYYWPWF